jgi:hypothetical protein
LLNYYCPPPRLEVPPDLPEDFEEELLLLLLDLETPPRLELLLGREDRVVGLVLEGLDLIEGFEVLGLVLEGRVLEGLVLDVFSRVLVLFGRCVDILVDLELRVALSRLSESEFLLFERP